MDKKLKKQSIQDLNYAIKSAKLHQKKASLFIKNNGRMRIFEEKINQEILLWHY